MTVMIRQKALTILTDELFIGDANIQKVLWFKEPYDKITRYEGLYI